ncbi:hypothetical protein [Oceanobacillus alkalisoli]|uniref:hypothetical protein n=1 Tax=Oceanobacillus alkalisoli TaxID=2925113 RepID=UPI001EE449F3|nr:hypothetical protein [Oceanobacillus alkalisoli]MCG5103393.1 hypothetical protein [Oceanobacillus alkalisoli]
MAFGINRQELHRWKLEVSSGQIAFLTHYWIDERFPGCDTVTKVGCSDIEKLKTWGRSHELDEYWIDYKDKYPHYDLFGEYQREILRKEAIWEQIKRFNL